MVALDRNTKKYFSHQFSRGKSLLGRAIDFVMLRVSVFFACLLLLLVNIRSFALSLTLSLVITVTVSILLSIIKNIRFEKYMERKSEELYSNEILKQLILVSPEQLYSIIKKQAGQDYLVVLQQYPGEEITASQILRIYNAARAKEKPVCQVYSTAPYSEDCYSLAQKFGDIKVVLNEPVKLIEIAKAMHLTAKDDALEIAAAEELEKHKTRLRRTGFAFMPGNARKYFYCAALIGVSTIITGYKTYYPLMCAISVCLGIISWWLNRVKLRSAESEGLKE